MRQRRGRCWQRWPAADRRRDRDQEAAESLVDEGLARRRGSGCVRAAGP